MLCPCHSGKKYQSCCKPLHDGLFPSNALSLMRSRFAAYALQKPEYIIRTTHPDNPYYKENHDQWSREILDFCRNTKFQNLDILEVINEGDLSYVTFVSHLIQDHQEKQLIEKSSFAKIGKQWLYRDAISIRMIDK